MQPTCMNHKCFKIYLPNDGLGLVCDSGDNGDDLCYQLLK